MRARFGSAIHPAGSLESQASVAKAGQMPLPALHQPGRYIFNLNPAWLRARPHDLSALSRKPSRSAALLQRQLTPASSAISRAATTRARMRTRPLLPWLVYPSSSTLVCRRALGVVLRARPTRRRRANWLLVRPASLPASKPASACEMAARDSGRLARWQASLPAACVGGRLLVGLLAAERTRARAPPAC